jgi:hypothetical protein
MPGALQLAALAATILVLLGTAGAVGHAATDDGASTRAAPNHAMPNDSRAAFREGCGTTNPYVAVARFAATPDGVPGDGVPPPDAPAVVALRDTPGDDADAPVVLATHGQVGAVFGLAYDAVRGHLYAASYHKRGAPFGPGGPGAIYRIDTASGDVSTWAQLDAGPDRHTWRDDDEGAGDWVGVSSLGGIAVSDDGTELAVANLYHGRIDRLSLPDGRLLGTFRHGGFDTRWRLGARLHALTVHGGWLYHGVLDEDGDSVEGDVEGPVVHVFRSRADGSELEPVFVLPLGGDDVALTLGALVNAAWADAPPRLTDLALRPDGGMHIGLRSRHLDESVVPYFGVPGTAASIVGATVTMDHDGTSWTVSSAWSTADLEATGTLAALPGLDVVVAPSMRQLVTRLPEREAMVWRAELRWLAGDTHASLRSELVADAWLAPLARRRHACLVAI